MGIDRLTTSLLAEAKKQAEEITKAADWHLEKMLTEEKAKRAILLKKAEEDAMQLIEEQRKERLAWASLEAKRIISEAREDAIKSILEDLFTMLEDISKKSEYKDFLKRTTVQALGELKSDRLVLHCKKEDKAIVQTLVKDSTEIEDDLNSLGGFILETADGKIRLNLTLESVFETKREDLRKLIYQKLFDLEHKKSVPTEPKQKLDSKQKSDKPKKKKSED